MNTSCPVCGSTIRSIQGKLAYCPECHLGFLLENGSLRKTGFTTSFTVKPKPEAPCPHCKSACIYEISESWHFCAFCRREFDKV